MSLIELEAADLPEHQQEHFRRCIANGCTPQMALMLASRFSPIMGGSDRAFNEGARRKMNNLPAVNQKMVAMAQKAGINTNGKYHVAGLGAYNDPMAWVSTIDDAREVIKAKGLSSRGLINYQAPEKPPQPDTLLAPDIVNDALRRRLSDDESLAARVAQASPKKRASLLREQREQIVAAHGKPRRKPRCGNSIGQRLLGGLSGN